MTRKFATNILQKNKNATKNRQNHDRITTDTQQKRNKKAPNPGGSYLHKTPINWRLTSINHTFPRSVPQLHQQVKFLQHCFARDFAGAVPEQGKHVAEYDPVENI